MIDCHSRTGLAYRRLGPVSAPPLLLIQGVAMQLIDWPQPLLETLCKNLHTIVYDHPGIGKSAPARTPEFTLLDLAKDAIALLDELHLNRVHIAGYSMGGIIAELIAVHYPENVLSLVTMMSNAGENLATASKIARNFLQTYAERAADEETAVIQEIAAANYFLGRGQAFDEPSARTAAQVRFRRAYRPETVALQLQALESSSSRLDLLHRIDKPWLIIHGARDDLISPAHARAIAATNPTARYVEFEDMSHDFPPHRLDEIAQLIVRHCQGVS